MNSRPSDPSERREKRGNDADSLISDARIRERPPSEKLVWLVLTDADDWLARDDIEHETGLGRSTASHALRGLYDAGLIERRADPRRAQRLLYRAVSPAVPHEP